MVRGFLEDVKDRLGLTEVPAFLLPFPTKETEDRLYERSSASPLNGQPQTPDNNETVAIPTPVDFKALGLPIDLEYRGGRYCTPFPSVHFLNLLFL